MAKELKRAFKEEAERQRLIRALGPLWDAELEQTPQPKKEAIPPEGEYPPAWLDAEEPKKARRVERMKRRKAYLMYGYHLNMKFESFSDRVTDGLEAPGIVPVEAGSHYVSVDLDEVQYDPAVDGRKEETDAEVAAACETVVKQAEEKKLSPGPRACGG